jgi:hypothetical protein
MTGRVSEGGSVRNPIPLLVALSLLACKGEAPTQDLAHLVPGPTVDASMRVISDASGSLALEVSAFLRNVMKTHIQIARCPSFARIPREGESLDLGASTVCPPGSPTQDLAPGDTTTLTRVFSADTLAPYAPGTYAVWVVLTCSVAWEGKWVGTIQLPLTTPH